MNKKLVIPENLKNRWVILRSWVDSSNPKEPFPSGIVPFQELELIERIARAEDRVKELEALSEARNLGWKSCIDDLRTAAEICKKTEACIKELEAENARLRAPETAIRMFLWLNHGHSGQYGDDGEMQCGSCMPFGVWDYKREPLDKLVQVATDARVSVNLTLLATRAKEPATVSHPHALHAPPAE